MNCPFWNPRKVIAFWVQSNKACYPTNLHHTTDCAVTCNTSSFFKEMANKLVLQVTLQSVVIVTQNEGETSFLAMLGLQLMLQVIDYLKMISETKYLSLTQMIVLSLATQACFSRSWQRSLCCKQHHDPSLSSSPNKKVKWACGEADWSVRDASKVHFGNHTPLHKGLCSHLQHKLVCHLHGKLDCLGDSKQAFC